MTILSLVNIHKRPFLRFKTFSFFINKKCLKKREQMRKTLLQQAKKKIPEIICVGFVKQLLYYLGLFATLYHGMKICEFIICQ